MKERPESTSPEEELAKFEANFGIDPEKEEWKMTEKWEDAPDVAADSHLKQMREDAEFVAELRDQIDRSVTEKNSAGLRHIAEQLTLFLDEELRRISEEPLSREEKKFYRNVLKGKEALPTEPSFFSLLLKEAGRAREAAAEMESSQTTKEVEKEIEVVPPEIGPAEELPAFELRVNLSPQVEALKNEEVRKIENRLREIDRLAGSTEEREKSRITAKDLETEAAMLLNERKRLEGGTVRSEVVSAQMKNLESQLRAVENTLKRDAEKLSPEQKSDLYKQGENLEARRKELREYLVSGSDLEIAPVAAEKYAEGEKESESFENIRDRYIALRAEAEFIKGLEKNGLAGKTDRERRTELEAEIENMEFYRKFPERTDLIKRREIAQAIGARLEVFRKSRPAPKTYRKAA